MRVGDGGFHSARRPCERHARWPRVASTLARVENARRPEIAILGASPYDWDRLERAVRALVAQQEALRKELRALRGDLGERNHRIRALETQLLEANQRRQDTCKRIDELIAQLDQLDAQLASAEPSA